MTKTEVLEEYEVEECEKWKYKGRGQRLRGLKQELKIDQWRSAEREPKMATLLAEMLWVIKAVRKCSEAKRRNQKHGVAHGVAGCWQVCKAAVLSDHAGRDQAST